MYIIPIRDVVALGFKDNFLDVFHRETAVSKVFGWNTGCGNLCNCFVKDLLSAIIPLGLSGGIDGTNIPLRCSLAS